MLQAENQKGNISTLNTQYSVNDAKVDKFFMNVTV